MKKQHIIFLLCGFTLLAVAVPWIVNESYKMGGYVTLWGAPEMLTYVGAVIGAIGTIFIGIIAIIQSDRANEISNKLLKMEELRLTPFLHLDTAICQLNCLTKHEVDITLGFRNETEGVINIVSAKPLQIEAFCSGRKTDIHFAEEWTEHFSVLPHQTRGFNFFDESKGDADMIIDLPESANTKKPLMFTCKVSIRLKYVNSSDMYSQNYEFNLYMHIDDDEQTGKKIYTGLFDNVENSICKE